MAWHESFVVCVFESARRRTSGYNKLLVRHATFSELMLRVRQRCVRRALYDREWLEIRLMNRHQQEITPNNYASFRPGTLQHVIAHVRDIP